MDALARASSLLLLSQVQAWTAVHYQAWSRSDVLWCRYAVMLRLSPFMPGSLYTELCVLSASFTHQASGTEVSPPTVARFR
jgi:hypothetical protein